MADVNKRNQILDFHQQANTLSHDTLAGEGPENMDHNDSTEYFYGNYKIVTPGYDGEDDSIDNYIVMGYENKIPFDKIDNMFTCYSDEIRSKTKIPHKGVGISKYFSKYGAKIEIVSMDGINLSYYSIKLLEHINSIKENENLDITLNKNKYVEEEKCTNKTNLFSQKPHIKTIYENLKNAFKNNINMPNSLIFIKLLHDLNNKSDIK